MQDFRNLKVWEKAHTLTLDVYNQQVFSARRNVRFDESDTKSIDLDRLEHC